VPCQQLCLDVPEEAYRDLLPYERVCELIPLPLLVRNQHILTHIVIHQDRAVLQAPKVCAPNLAAIDQRKNEAISKEGTKLLQKVEGKAWASRPIAVEKAYRWIQSYRFKCGANVVNEQSIYEGQKSIHRVEWRPPASAIEAELGVVISKQILKYQEIDVSRFAFEPAQLIDGSRLLSSAGNLSQFLFRRP